METIKYKPILFSSSMVNANLEDKKTKTRRQVTGEALKWLEPDMFTPEYVASPENNLCPYGKVGDVLWVRETFAKTTNVNSLDPWPGRNHIRTDGETEGVATEALIYRADGEWQWCDDDGFHTERSYWKPSIFMPRYACRLFLKIKEIKIERLQDVSESDAISEGIYMRITSTPPYEQKYQIPGWPNLFNTAKQAFKSLWISINSKDSWDNNPWVWVIEYERIEKPKNFTQ